MAILTNEDVTGFCRLCSWTVEAWATHRAFQDHALMEGHAARRHAFFLNRLSIITQEYTLQQVMKLHDPAYSNGRANLSIAFVVEQGDWEASTKARLVELRSKLDAFASHLRTARNRTLAHHDREAVLAHAELGDFPEGDDDRYFEVLAEFVDVVHRAVVGGPFALDDFATGDAEAFIEQALSLNVQEQRLRIK